MDALVEFILKYKNIIIGGLIGLILAILLFTIGFFKTLILLVLVLIGALFGGVPSARQKVAEFFRKLFNGNK